MELYALSHLSRRRLAQKRINFVIRHFRYSSSLTCSIQSTGLPFSAS
jgi:hypothetical protein